MPFFILCAYNLDLDFRKIRYVNKNNGAVLSYTGWAPGQPDVDYTIVANYPIPGRASTWDDVGSAYAAQFVCEF